LIQWEWNSKKKYRVNAWHLAGETSKVPAQRMIDFTQKNKVSSDIPKTPE
jgi:uncharacterized FAD-dependent dehydrogenase